MKRLFCSLCVMTLLVGCGAERPPVSESQQNASVVAGRELLSCEEAIAPRDIQFMLRSGSAQNEIIAELQKRGLTERMDRPTLANLVSMGASPELLKKIETSHVLSEEERRRQSSRQSLRDAAAARAVADRQYQQTSAEHSERQRQQYLQAILIKQAERKERQKRIPLSCPLAR